MTNMERLMLADTVLRNAPEVVRAGFRVETQAAATDSASRWDVATTERLIQYGFELEQVLLNFMPAPLPTQEPFWKPGESSPSA